MVPITPEPPRHKQPGRSMVVHIRRGVTVGAVALLASVAVLQPAQADTETFRDKAGDTGVKADITTVRVKNGANRVTVVVRPGRLKSGDYFRFWLDTVPKNRGPEYKVEVYPNSDGFGLVRVGSFRDKGKLVGCPGLRANADIFTPDRVSISVPRSCMHNPGSVRVSVRGHYEYRGPDVVDWAPAKRKFFGWVAR
jgi:hypothetical protein